MDVQVGIEQSRTSLNQTETQPIPERKSGEEFYNSEENDATSLQLHNPIPSTLDRKEIVECIDFCRQVLDSFSNKICSCQSPYDRNGNAFTGDTDGQQLYPHMKKFYNHDTDSLEHVRIVMSTSKPVRLIDEQQDETLTQRRGRRTRVSKQRARALITEFCTRKASGDILTNKRKYSSLWFLLC